MDTSVQGTMLNWHTKSQLTLDLYVERAHRFLIYTKTHINVFNWHILKQITLCDTTHIMPKQHNNFYSEHACKSKKTISLSLSEESNSADSLKYDSQFGLWTSHEMVCLCLCGLFIPRTSQCNLECNKPSLHILCASVAYIAEAVCHP